MKVNIHNIFTFTFISSLPCFILFDMSSLHLFFWGGLFLFLYSNKMTYHGKHKHGTAWELPANLSYLKTISDECNTQWFVLFCCVWISVIASVIITLAWLKKGRKSEARRFGRFSDLPVWCFSVTLHNINTFTKALRLIKDYTYSTTNFSSMSFVHI